MSNLLTKELYFLTIWKVLIKFSSYGVGLEGKIQVEIILIENRIILNKYSRFIPDR